MAPRLAHTGQAAVRLSSQSLASTLLPVEAGQQVMLTAYAHATHAPTRRWLGPAAQAVASSLVISTRPVTGPGLPEQPQAAGRQAFPYLGVGVALGLPHLRYSPRTVSAGASLQYRIYDQTGAFIGAGQQPVLTTRNDDWQPLNLTITVPAKGFIQIVLANSAQAPVYFDDLHAQVSPSVHQANLARQFTAPMNFSLAEESGEPEPPVTNLHINEDNGSSNPMYDPHPGEPTGPQGGTSPGPGFPGSGSSYPLPGGTVTGFPPSNPSPYFPPVYIPGQYTPNDPPTGGGGGGSVPGPSPLTSIPNLPKTVTKQATPATCVPATLAAISNLCPPPIEEKAIDLWYDQNLNTGTGIYSSILFTGVGLSTLGTLVSHYFNVTVVYPVNNTIGIINQIAVGHPVMIDIPTGSTVGSTVIKHSVVITGYDPVDPTKFFYLDPITGDTQTQDAATLMSQTDYMIPITSCK